MDYKHALIDFEKQADQIADNLSIFSFPRRSLLTALYLMIDSLIHGSRLNADYPPQPLKGSAVVARLSYLMKHIFRCPAEPIGESAHDAFSVFDSMNAMAELNFLVAYGHFSELMPEVHRNYYRVSKNGEKFVLSYATPEFAEAEVRDVILSELARGFSFYPKSDQSLFDEQAKRGSRFDLALMMVAISRFYSHFLENSFELQIISDEGLNAAVGVTFEEFRRFKAAWMAIAQYSSAMAAAIGRRVAKKEISREKALPELLEWTSPMLKETFLSGMVMALTGLSAEKMDSLLTVFALDAETAKLKQVGDGFYPPLLLLSKCFLFNPSVLQLTFSSRNIIYALSRMDSSRFDKIVSQYLEPQLIKLACVFFDRVPDLKVVTNVDWKSGEIDILVYQKSENTILHVQVKAAIPPEGARRIEAVEKRVLEGLEQLERFRQLEQLQIDSVVSRAVEEEVNDIRVIDVLLVWSSFGTEKVWSQKNDVIALSLPLLNLVTDRNPNFKLHDLERLTEECFNDLRAKTDPKWTVASLMLDDVELEIPLLEINTANLLADKESLQIFVLPLLVSIST